MKREQLHVCKVLDGWAVMHSGFILEYYSRKDWAVEYAKECTAAHVESGGIVQIIIHLANGRIQRDITLPRSSDPKKTKG
jgi:hypothetical protein